MAPGTPHAPHEPTAAADRPAPQPLRRIPGTETIERTCDAIILVLLVGVLVLTPIAFGGVEQDLAPISKTPFATVLYYFNYAIAAAAVLMVLVWAIKMVLAERIVLARTPMDLPLLLFLAYALVRALTCAAPAVALREVGWLAAYVAIFYVAVNVLRTRRKQHIVAGAIVATAVLLTLVGLVLKAHPKTSELALTLDRPRQYEGRLGASYICPNHFAGYLEMAIPLVMAFVMISKARLAHKLIVGAAGVTMLVAIILTMSRGAWISLVLGIAILLVAATTQKRINLLAWLIPLIVIVATVAAIVLRSEKVRERFGKVADTKDVSYGGRATIWKHTLDVVQRHPLFGTGPGTYKWAFTRALPPPLSLDVRYAHNDYLQTLSDYGIVGLALALWAAGAFGYRGVRALRRAKKSDDLALIIGILASATAVAVHSFVDFNMRIPANLVTMFVLAALLVAVRQYQLRRLAELVVFKRSDTARLRTATKVTAIAALVLASAAILVVNGRKHAARVAYHRGLEQDMTVVKPMALKQRVIKEILRAKPLPAEQLDTVVRGVGQLEGPTCREVEAEIRETAKELNLKPDKTDALVRAAWRATRLTLDDYDRLAATYQKAVRLDGSNFEFEAALLNLYRSKGVSLLLRKDAALEAFSKAIAYGEKAFRLNRLSAFDAYLMGETYKWTYSVLKADDPFGLVDRSAYEPLEFYEREAREWYDMAIGLHPENGLYRQGYGQFLEWAGELRSALVQYKKGLEIFPEGHWEHAGFRNSVKRIENKLQREREPAPVEPAADDEPPAGGGD